MFGKSELIEKIEALEKRVKQLEDDCRPMYAGELDAWERRERSRCFSYLAPYKDPRPRLSLHDVAMKLMAHCKLTFERIPAVSEKVVVKKRK